MNLPFNEYLNKNKFLPLILSSILSSTIFIGRVFISGDNFIYRNLIWNLFLAWIPYFFSLIVGIIDRYFQKYYLILIMACLGWLVFFPNAPYIVTDFLHLYERPGIPLWYDIVLISSFAWTGCFLAVASLRIIHTVIDRHMGRIMGWLSVIVSLGLAGTGIYLGRFLRWNTWDLLTNPKAILKDVVIPVLNPLSNLKFFAFTLLFTAFLAVIYLMFFTPHQKEISDQVDS